MRKRMPQNNQKAEISSIMFLYVIAVIILAGTLILGFMFTRNSTNTMKQMPAIAFRRSLSADISELRYLPGSVKKANYDVSSDYNQICFISTTDPSTLPIEFSQQNPVIADATQTSDNVFLIGNKVFDTFSVSDIHPGFTCVPIERGKLTLYLESTGDSTVVSAAKPIRTTLNIPAGQTDEAITIISDEYTLTLNIPAMTTITYPVGVQAAIIIEQDPEQETMPGLITLGAVHSLQPEGTQFSPAIDVVLDYDPSRIIDPKNIVILHYYENDWHQILNPIIDETLHTLTVSIDHFSSLMTVADCKNMPVDVCLHLYETCEITSSNTCGPKSTPTLTEGCGGDPTLEFDDEKDVIIASAYDPYRYPVLKIFRDGTEPVFYTDLDDSKNMVSEIIDGKKRTIWTWDNSNTGHVISTLGNNYRIEFWKDCSYLKEGVLKLGECEQNGVMCAQILKEVSASSQTADTSTDSTTPGITMVPTGYCSGEPTVELDKNTNTVQASSFSIYRWCVLKIFKDGEATPVFNSGGLTPERITTRTEDGQERVYWQWDDDNTNNEISKLGDEYRLEFWKDCVDDNCDMGGIKCVTQTVSGTTTPTTSGSVKALPSIRTEDGGEYDAFGNIPLSSTGVYGDKIIWSGGDISSASGDSGLQPVPMDNINDWYQYAQGDELYRRFGATEDQVGRNLVSVQLMGRTIYVHKCAAPAYRDVAARIEKLEEEQNLNYNFVDSGTFVWRTLNLVGDTSRRSWHSWAIATDIGSVNNPRCPIITTEWCKNEDGTFRDDSYFITNMPLSFVNAWKQEDFVWGGDFTSRDPMHYEWHGWQNIPEDEWAEICVLND